jgi:hypothetical protein
MPSQYPANEIANRIVPPPAYAAGDRLARVRSVRERSRWSDSLEWIGAFRLSTVTSRLIFAISGK